MRIKFFGILVICLFFLTSCKDFFDILNSESETEKNNPDSTTETPAESTSEDIFLYKTLTSDESFITFSKSYEGKKCYLICSNESSQSVNNGTVGIQFNQNNNESNRSADGQDLFILKNTVRFTDGSWRDEIQFERPELEIIQSRAAASNATNQTATYRDLSDNKFWAQTGVNIFTKNTFEKKSEGTYCRIWYLNNNSSVSNANLTDSEFKKLAATVDSIFTKETQVFGSNHYSKEAYCIKADQNTKLDVLVYDLMGDASENQNGGVFGFFRAWDFYLNSMLTQNNINYGTSYKTDSNECQVIHVDSFFLNADVKNNTQKVQSTLIHEFQHLLNYCNKNTSYETWFTEMLSMSAEDVFQSQINLSDEDSPKSRFYITFDAPYHGFGNWPANNDEKVYNAYANAYAFGAYLMRNYGGVKLVHEIATNQYINEEAITRALQTLGYNETFESVFRKFGMVYIFPEYNNDSNIKNLNRSVSEIYLETTYSLGAINLNDYYFKFYNSKTVLDNDINNNLYAVGQKVLTGTDNNNQTLYAILGPRIFKSSYQLQDPINKYGFAVYYLGTIQAGKKYTVNHKQNLTMTLVIKG